MKLIIKCNGDEYHKIHTIVDLYNKSKLKDEFEKYITENTVKYNIDYNIEKLTKDLETISTAFIDWRYIYEKEDICISSGFLKIFSEYLDRYCVELIKNRCGIDMAKHTII